MSVSRQTVLLVEDNPDDVLLLQRALRGAKPERLLQTVSTGEDAVLHLGGEGPYADRRAHPLPSILIVDLKLPGMSGFELLAWIRHRPKFRKMRVIVLTGSPRTIDIYRAFELGANSYLVKPVTAEAFEEACQNLNAPRLLPSEPPALAPESVRASI